MSDFNDICRAGKVATGAEHVLKTLGARLISVDELPNISAGSRDPIYYCMIPPSAYFRRDDGAAWDRADYYANPGRWESDFGDRVSHAADDKVFS